MLLLLFFFMLKFKKKAFFYLLSIIFAVVAADFVASGLMKDFFKRLRPSHEPNLKNLVHILNNYEGGTYGMASSHAANSFAFATIIWLILKGKPKALILLFLWAIIVSYSRIYLGVHYPADVLVGAVIGILTAYLSKNILNIYLKS